MPWQVDRLPIVTVAWLTNQLIEHESGAEKWWKNPFGFNLLASNDPNLPEVFPPVTPPAGYQRLPFEEG